jgi:serine/threonine protein kinase
MFVFIFRISGGRLFDYLCFQSIILEQKIAKYIRQLLDGLNYLHQSKIVHLDIQVNLVRRRRRRKMIFFFSFSRKIY